MKSYLLRPRIFFQNVWMGGWKEGWMEGWMERERAGQKGSPPLLEFLDEHIPLHWIPAGYNIIMQRYHVLHKVMHTNGDDYHSQNSN